MSVIELASSQSIRPFKSSEEYVYAMKEDLAEWLKDLYGVDVDVKNLVRSLQTGSLLCLHANNVTRAAADFRRRQGGAHLQLPTAGVSFISSARPSTFQARDNLSNFINWCRTEMHIKDVLMFETDDLVLRKNEKNVVLCLLEVARRASRFGMAAPVLIQLEREIEEEEMRVEASPERDPPPPALAQKRLLDTQDLDEMVQRLTSSCTCPAQFPVVKISEGKYRVGDSNTLIFILRSHVMVRVGGGWDTLEHYLDKHDPCRCTSLTHKLAHYPGPPLHEIKARESAPDGQATPQTCLLLSRVQSPADPLIRTPSGPPRAGLRSRSSPTTPKQTDFKSKDDSVLESTSRTSRQSNRGSPAPRLSSSLPRPQTQRSSTPLVLQKVDGQTVPKPQQDPGVKLGQTWTKTHFVSKLRQNAGAGTKNKQELSSFPETAKPVQCTNSDESSLGNCQPPTFSVQETGSSARKKSEVVGTFCPCKGRLGVTENETWPRSSKMPLLTPVSNALVSVRQSDFKVTTSEPFETHPVVDVRNGNGNLEKGHLFTPPPIGPAQEAVLYQSLEEEILSNLKQLGLASDGSDSENEACSSSETPLNSPSSSGEYRKRISSASKAFAKLASKPEAIADEPSRQRRWSDKGRVESWANAFSRTHSCRLKVSRSSSSWTSLGSSMESKDLLQAPEVSDADQTTGTDLTPRIPNFGVDNTEEPLSSSGKKRSLKKPERVPSIYKLKLRPRVRPRRDNRPDKKPTKIPKPVYYWGSQSNVTRSSGDSSAPNNAQNVLDHRRASTLRSSGAGGGAEAQRDREMVANEELEYWV